MNCRFKFHSALMALTNGMRIFFDWNLIEKLQTTRVNSNNIIVMHALSTHGY